MRFVLVVLTFVLLVPTTNADLLGNLFFSSETVTLEDLDAEFPDVAQTTAGRFHSAFGVESADKLADYLDWKEKHTLTWGVDTDADTRWKLLVEQSIAYLNETSPELITAALIEHPPNLPVIYSTNATDNDGNVLIQLLPKRMTLDSDVRVPVELYTDVLASYLDIELDEEAKCTLMVDFRPGRGWPNTPYTSLLGTVRQLSKTLNNLLPGKVARALAFPMPAYGRAIWRLWQPIVGNLVVPLVLVPGGSAKLFEPVPKEGLMKYMDGDVVDQTEALRLSLWRD